MKLRLSLLVITALLLVSFEAVEPTRAQYGGFHIYYTLLIGGTCTNTSFSIPSIRTYVFDPTTGPTFQRIDSVGGSTVLDSVNRPPLIGTGTISTPPITNLTAVYNQAQPYVYTIMYDWSYNQVPFFQNIITITCNNNVATGTVVNLQITGNTTPVPIVSGTPTGTSVPGSSGGGFQGPGIPYGFVLHTITCNTPVYNTPAGTPVGANMLTAGQTWFVNPTPVNGSDGQQWTEFFDGGYINGFIPTSCVQ